MRPTRRLKRDLDGPIMTVLDRSGPLSTGEICDLINVLAPVTEVKPVQHGKARYSTKGPNWEVCPNCDCTEEVEVSRPYLAPRVRSTLKRMEKKNLVVEIKTLTPNNKGGHLWLRADQVDEYYTQIFSA